MNVIQITTICISLAAMVLNLANMARTHRTLRDAEARAKELEQQIASAKWDV